MCLRLSQDNVLVLLCDGHGSHLTWQFIEYAKAHHIMVLLRPPHTTQVLQGEDVHGFGIFKKAFKAAKQALLTERFLAFEQNH